MKVSPCLMMLKMAFEILWAIATIAFLAPRLDFN
jgi:hypothetical protein